MTDEQLWNEYLIPGTDVLINKFKIKTKEELKEVEKIITRKSLAKLYLKPEEGNFDIEHLKKIHKRIFKDIYPFAGEFRKCSLQKEDHIFCMPNDINNLLKEILENMNKEFEEEIYSSTEFAFKLAKYYYDIIYIHPFREGNGRTIRTFIRDFTVEKSKGKACGEFDLDYTKIDGANLLLGTAQRYIYPNFIEMEFMKGLVKKDINDIMRKRK